MTKTRLILLASTVLVASRDIEAGCAIDHVQYAMRGGGKKTISLAFTGVTATIDNTNAAHPSFTIVDLTNNTVSPTPGTISADLGKVPTSGEVTPNSELSKTNSYLLTVRGIPGCEKDDPLTAKVGFVDSSAPAILRSFAFAPTKGRSDSDIYLSGLINGAHHQKASYTADIKAQMNIIVKSAVVGSRGPEISVIPTFDFTASTSRNADGNSVTIGTFIRIASPASAPGWRRYAVFEPGFALQADKYFRAETPLFRLPVYFTPRLGNLQRYLYLQPLAGLEAGAYAKLPEAKEYAVQPSVLPPTTSIARPIAGGSAYVYVYAAKKPVFSFQTDFIRRWPLIGEPNYSQDSNGKLTLINLGRNPRDYITLKVQRDITPYFGFTLQYDYGRMPPLYTLVDRKYSIAITYKTGLKAKQ